MFRGYLILAVVSAAAGIQVSIPKQEYEVARGDNVTLPCNFVPAEPDVQVMTVAWSVLSDDPGEKSKSVATFFHPPGAVDITAAFEKKASFKPDLVKKSADLVLSDVTLAENKVFECDVKILGDDSGVMTAVTRLVVLVAPSKPICKTHGATEYGRNINLTCMSEEGSPDPTYTWKRYDVQNRPASLPPRTTEKQGQLSLFNISIDTSGYYICTSENKIRSASCNMTLTVLPPSMNIGSTAGIIGGCIAALLVLGIVVYCCCCKKKKKEKEPVEYAMGTAEEGAYSDKDPRENESDYHDDRRENPSSSMGDRSPRGRISPEERHEERSDRNYDRRDDPERRERYDDRASDYDDDRRDKYKDRARDYDDDRRDKYADRARDYDDDRRDKYDDQGDRYSDRRDRHDDRRDHDDDRYDRRDRESDRETDRRSDY
ncbi:hypothetical protein SKAU_G00242800 [Synaphobranchus kaupii]|uniref:Ig-like domain-containing protein n=1 Tax=Synaphobranchus kaupii TaxID=118154 RepID=A0A9Q1F7V1_SYNKA|nr:hypothetical protein SKAU_G00242800 [Synaphobranchus kaupii]